MRITKIHIKNIHSLRDPVTIDFERPPLLDSGLFAITGDTGAGKTTILDAITLALYGRVHRNKEVKEVMSYGAVESLAQVDFRSRAGKFRATWSIWRSRGKADGSIQGPKRELAVWNPAKEVFEIIAEKIREVDEQVEAVSGLDYDRFTRSTLLSQGDFAAFMRAGERERSELLERITGSAIYSNLSVAAFEKNKEETARLDDLRRQREHLSLLSPEEHQLLSDQYDALQKDIKALEKQIKDLQSLLHDWSRLEELRLKNSDLERQKNKLDEDKTTLKDQTEKLETSQKTLPFRTDLHRIKDWEQEKESLTEIITRINQELETQRGLLHEKRAELPLVSNRLQALKADWNDFQKLYEIILKLDVSIEEKRQQLSELESESPALEKEITALVDKQAADKEILAQSIRRIGDLESWLAEKKSWNNLTADLPGFEIRREQLREIFRQQRALEEELKVVEAEQTVKSANLDQSRIMLKAEEAQREALLQRFEAGVPEKFTSSRAELITLIFREIDTLNEEKQHMEQLLQLADQYRSMLADLAETEEELEHLQREELDLSKQLMNAVEQVESLLPKLEFRQKIFEQQLTIASYEKDRAALEEGEPCPVCQSTHHPFRDDPHFKPMVDEAQAELEAIRKKYEAAGARYSELGQLHAALNTRIEQLIGSDREEKKGQVQKQRERIIAFEDKIHHLSIHLMPHYYEEARILALEKSIQEKEALIQARKKLETELTQLHQKMEGLENEIKGLSENVSRQENALILLEEKASQIRNRLADLRQQFDKETDHLNSMLDKYGITFDPANGKAVFEQLTAMALEYDQAQQELSREREMKTVLEQTLGLDGEKADNLRKKQKALIVQLEKMQAVLHKLTGERVSQFGDKDPQSERDNRIAALEQAESEAKQLEEAVTRIESEVKSGQNLLEDKKRQSAQVEARMEQVISGLLSRIEKVGFGSLAALEAAILPPEEEERISALKQSIDQREAGLSESIPETQRLLAAAEGKIKGRQERSVAEAALQQAEQTLQANLQETGAIREKLAEQDRRKNAAAELNERIEAQKKELLRWARLNDLIGQADGKKFRIFAQGLTLQKLVELANIQLEKLNGRYFIRKRSEEDLELDIVDTYQANNFRSMNTLSGGESFLVSLALALGLSDLAGRDTRIESLFIDEGFGTLDDSSLDLAISTLENLQASGKKIGLISHVPALKERIGVQILVNKRGNGFSLVEVKG